MALEYNVMIMKLGRHIIIQYYSNSFVCKGVNRMLHHVSMSQAYQSMTRCRSMQESLISCKHWMCWVLEAINNGCEVIDELLVDFGHNPFGLWSSHSIHEFIQYPLLHLLQRWILLCGSRWRTQHPCSSLSLWVHCNRTDVLG